MLQTGLQLRLGFRGVSVEAKGRRSGARGTAGRRKAKGLEGFFARAPLKGSGSFSSAFLWFRGLGFRVGAGVSF